jgi:hypothetical protein
MLNTSPRQRSETSKVLLVTPIGDQTDFTGSEQALRLQRLSCGMSGTEKTTSTSQASLFCNFCPHFISIHL